MCQGLGNSQFIGMDQVTQKTRLLSAPGCWLQWQDSNPSPPGLPSEARLTIFLWIVNLKQFVVDDDVSSSGYVLVAKYIFLPEKSWESRNLQPGEAAISGLKC